MIQPTWRGHYKSKVAEENTQLAKYWKSNHKYLDLYFDSKNIVDSF